MTLAHRIVRRGAGAARRARLAIATFVSGAKVVRRNGQDEVHYVDPPVPTYPILCSGRAPLLVEHQFYIEAFIGQVQEAWVSSTQRAHAIVRFADMPEAERLWQLLTQGFPLGISAGYRSARLNRSKMAF